MCVELQSAAHDHGFPVVMEVVRPILYEGTCVGHHRFDVMFGECIVEIKVNKTGDGATAAHVAQLARYTRHKLPTECVVLVVFGEDTARTLMQA